MFSYQIPYTHLGGFMFCILLLISLLLCLTLLISTNNPTAEKLSAYECGFEAFNDTQQQQDIRYFILGLLFILFDIEIMFLFPWVSSLILSGNFIFWIGLDFLLELGVGYLVLWKLYIFDWN